MLCPKCGNQTDDKAKFCQSCGAAFQSTPGVSAPAPQIVFQVTAVKYVGFWTRFVAWMIDVVIILLGSGIAGALTFGAGALLVFVGPWLYEAFMLSSEWQATVGKRAMSIVVTGIDGNRISFARATGRHFAKYISTFLLCIGYIMAAFTAKKQALHDMIAETLVIER
jgi:uncharacterized RDD family membrane protein YckC